MKKNNKLVGDLYCLQNIVYGVSATRRRLIGLAADTGDIVSDIVTTTGDPFSVTVYDASVNVTYDGKLQFSFRYPVYSKFKNDTGRQHSAFIGVCGQWA